MKRKGEKERERRKKTWHNTEKAEQKEEFYKVERLRRKKIIKETVFQKVVDLKKQVAD